MTRVYSREEVRTLPVRARRALGGMIQGEAKTRLCGAQGLEVSDFREYEPGDDVGRIDWNMTARLGKPWVRMYPEERGHPVFIVADVSSSTRFGRSELPVQHVIADVAARLASAAIWNGHETGLLLFSDRVRKYIPAVAGVNHLSGIVRELKRTALGCAANGIDGATDVACALDYLVTLRRRRCLVFLLSDFVSRDFSASLQRCAQRHELIAIRVSEPAHLQEFPTSGLLNLRDPETGRLQQIDTDAVATRRVFREMLRQRHEEPAGWFRKAGVDYLPLAADANYANTVVALLRQRAV